MENIKNYAFTQANHLGQPRPPVRTPLWENQGVWLCQPDSFVPQDRSPALVWRENAKSAWQPVLTLEELGQLMSSGSSACLGVWVDRPRWGLFGTADGKIQDKEVEPMANRWQSLRLDELTQFEDKGYRTGDPDHPPRRCIVGWWNQIAEVIPSGVRLLPAAFPDKVVAVLEEPRQVVAHEVIVALRLQPDRTGQFLQPSLTSHTYHGPEGTTREAHLTLEACLQRGAKEPPVYVLPED